MMEISIGKPKKSLKVNPEICAFLEALNRDPNDDTTRLVFADWLEEHGNIEQAMRLRRFVELKQNLGETNG